METIKERIKLFVSNTRKEFKDQLKIISSNIRSFSSKNYINYSLNYEKWIATYREGISAYDVINYCILILAILYILIALINVFLTSLHSLITFHLPMYWKFLFEGESIWDDTGGIMKEYVGIDALFFVLFYSLLWIVLPIIYLSSLILYPYTKFSFIKNESSIKLNTYKKKLDYFHTKIKTPQWIPFIVILSLWLVFYYLQFRGYLPSIYFFLYFLIPLMMDLLLTIIYIPNLFRKRKFKKKVLSYYKEKSFPSLPDYISPKIFVDKDYKIKFPSKKIILVLLLIILRDYSFLVELIN